MARRARLTPALIVLEALGGYQTALVGELATAELAVAVVNSAPGAGIRARHRAVGEARGAGCASAGAVRRAGAAAAAGVALDLPRLKNPALSNPPSQPRLEGRSDSAPLIPITVASPALRMTEKFWTTEQ